MVKSMTGYGKAEATVSGSKYTIEIRSLNGKNCDITLKTSVIPREKEMDVRHFLTSKLGRGTIDLYINVENVDSTDAGTINGDVLKAYYDQTVAATEGSALNMAAREAGSALLAALLRMPNVVENKKTELDESQWDILYGAICQAAEALCSFREREGEILRSDVLSKVDLIESYIPQIEALESERIEATRKRIEGRIAEIGLQPDANRLEQEIIFYIEKLDVNEEKVRLRQHCRYYRETIDGEEMPGRKLGFIAQEMGREINTLGSKANHAGIQKLVVKMKDELEKIKEQSLNIL
ncbi:MAG: YicC family protein [Bacteroidales bacterium]|nr:YicC family protein [Bacteroidales bacterium]